MTSVDEAEFHRKFRRDVWKASKSGAPPMRTLRYVDYLKTKDDRPSDLAAVAMFGVGVGTRAKREVARCGGSSPMIPSVTAGGLGGLGTPLGPGLLGHPAAVTGPLATGGAGTGGASPPDATEGCPESIPCGTLPASFSRSRGGELFETPGQPTWGSSHCGFGWGVFTCETPQVNETYTCLDLSPRSRFNFEGGSDAQRAVVMAGFTLLQQNLDLVRWVVCLVFADYHLPILEAMINVPENVKVRFSSALHSVDGCAACADALAWACISQITICESTTLVERIWGEGWCCMRAEERLCIAIDAANLIFHELCHVVGLEVGPHAPMCDRIYLAESSLTWALLTRFPAARNDTCCSAAFGGEVLNPSLFMTENGTSIDVQCDVCDS